MIEVSKNRLWNLCLFSSACLLLLWAALLNGYPLLYSDSGTYIASGHIDYVPVDRPIIYGLFVRHLSLSWRLWLVVLLQAVFVNYIFYLLIKFFVGLKKTFFWIFLISLCLTVFTGISYFVSQLTADIFASVTVLTIFLIYSIPKKEKIHLIFLVILLGFSIISHLSHLPLALALILFLGAFELLRKKKRMERKNRILLLLLTLVSAVLILSLTNFLYGASARLSRASNVVVGARLIETGIANKHLKRVCDQEEELPYAELCDYIDQFDRWPAAGYYLHDTKSPLYAGDCLEKDWTNCWLEKDSTYQALIYDILGQEELLKEFILMAITGTATQFFTYELSLLQPIDFDYLIEQHYPAEKYLFEHSNQYKNTLHFEVLSFRQMVFIYISFLLLFYFLWKKRNKISWRAKLLVAFVLLALLLNAFICATFSNVVPRYQARLIFLLPLAVIMIGLELAKQYNRKKSINLKEWF